MKEIITKERTPFFINQLLTIWEMSVTKTHSFLSDEEIERIKYNVPQALSSVPLLIVETDKSECPVAFMGIKDRKLECCLLRRKSVVKV